MDGLVIVLEI